MLQKKIKYIDPFTEEEREKTLYFGLTKAELMELELTTEGGFMALIDQLIKTDKQTEIVKIFKKIVLDAYGERTNDGRFYKNEQMKEIFAASEEYSVVFMELATDSKAGSDFINGIVPKLTASEQAELDKIRAEVDANGGTLPDDYKDRLGKASAGLTAIDGNKPAEVPTNS